MLNSYHHAFHQLFGDSLVFVLIKFHNSNEMAMNEDRIPGAELNENKEGNGEDGRTPGTHFFVLP